jgi:hypothetical protein
MNPGDPCDLQRSYSGHLRVASLALTQTEDILAIAQRYGVELDVGTASLDVEYIGRDTNRFIVLMLVELAAVVGEADGEVECHVSGDTGQHWFEFFEIKNGQLYCQLAEVVRGCKKIVQMPRPTQGERED